ncbi:MAG: carbohydrate ABC transporter permease [Treponema sp.]|jgi:putative aldouronate transport system permease protein|nr:carbohydrate ABC transporter permease [Treponema sp.]
MIVTERKSGFLWKALINLLFIALSVCCVAPLLLILSASFTTELGLSSKGYSFIPSDFSLQAYEFIFQNPAQLFNSYGVTIFVTAAGTFCGLLVTSALAYVISRRDFKLYRLFSFMTLFTLLFSGGMVPSYIIITKYYHLKDTIFVLILPYLLSSWYVFLMKGFFLDIPSSLVEAAKIDGAREVSIFFRIIIPISKPALATVGLFIAFAYWNDWWLSMLYIDSARLTSLQFYLYRIMNNIQFLAQVTQNVNVSINLSEMPSETARMALCVLAAGPMLVIFPFFQRYFVRGITMGAVKG